MIKTTAELRFGDLVALPGRRVRTVSHVEPSPYVNSRNEPIVNVMYAEGRTDDWGAGNSAINSTRWTLLPCPACGSESCDCFHA